MKGKQQTSYHVNPPKVCYRCGGPHLATTCRFVRETCRACGKTGHIARVCRSKRSEHGTSSQGSGSSRTDPRIRTHLLEVSNSSSDPSFRTTSNPSSSTTTASSEVYTMFPVVSRSKPFTLSVMINNHPLPMELDTGASVSVISESTYNTVLKDTVPLESTDISLCTYMGEELPVLGVATVAVGYESQTTSLPLVVVKGDGASLFGRNWLERIKLNWSVIHSVSNNLEVDVLLQKHQQLFREELGTLKGVETQIHVPPNTQPRYFKPRPLAYSLKAKVEKELHQLQEAGLIRPIQFSDWAAPIVPIVKVDGSIRICGDYKVTVNTVSKLDNYPLPRVDDLFTAISGGKVFSKLIPVLLSESSKKYTTINTTKGLFEYQRLPFGISSAPAIFQRPMESLLQDLPGVVVYLDDVLVTGPNKENKEEHLKNLDKVMDRLKSAGVTLKQPKCIFLAPSVEYLGHIIDKNGLHPAPEKVRAIQDSRRTT